VDYDLNEAIDQEIVEAHVAATGTFPPGRIATRDSHKSVGRLDRQPGTKAVPNLIEPGKYRHRPWPGCLGNMVVQRVTQRGRKIPTAVVREGVNNVGIVGNGPI
jgi:hypothetical protein